MKQSIAWLIGLIIGYLFIKFFLFNPKKKEKQSYRKRYEERKKNLNARDESLYKDRG
jgi:uncharacterized membrane-anchored protein YhcB (DUF1043 family)